MIEEIQEATSIKFVEEGTNQETLRLTIFDQSTESGTKFDFGEIQFV